MIPSPRFSRVLISAAVALSCAPASALAQVAERAAPEGLVSASVLAPVAAPAAAPSLAPALAPFAAAPSAAALPMPAPAPSAVPAVSAASAESEIVASAKTRAPGPAATAIAAEALAYAPAPAPRAAAPAPSSRRGVLSRLADAALGRAAWSSVFDGGRAPAKSAAPVLGGRTGVRELGPLTLPNGQAPDSAPSLPSPEREPGVSFQTYALPGAREVGGILEPARLTLSADPADPAALAAELRRVVDGDAARYGVAGSDLRLVHAKRVPGRAGLADTTYVVFRQTRDGLEVHGSALSFTLKTVGGRARIVAQAGRLFPNLDVDTSGSLSDEEVRARIARRTGLPPQDVADHFQFSGEKIIYSHGRWRHVKLYAAEGLPFMVAVDMSDGQVMAWDNRTGLRQSKPKGAAAQSAVTGKTVDHGPILPGAKIASVPLAFLNLTVGGKTYTTDKDGRFSAPGLTISPKGLTLKATLSGPFATVQDQQKKTLAVSVTLKSDGSAVQVVFNPDASLDDENALAQVSAFQKINLAYAFLKERGLTTDRMDQLPIPVRSNLDDECNAYYTPGSPSLNFFRSSANCVNSAYDTVADHEYGHYWDDMTGGITDAGLSEGWGDTLSMYLLNNPVVGEHFLKHPGPDGKDYIRDGRNTYKYNEYDEAHDQGQAWGGFTWKLRAAMIDKLGEAAGAALAEALVLPTMFAKAANIPEAVAQVLVNAMKSDGTLVFEKEIRAIAKLHGLPLPQAPRGRVARLASAAAQSLRRLGLFPEL